MFEELLVGVVAGLFTGVGTALLFQYVTEQGERDGGSGTTGGVPVQRFHRGAAGMALSPAGVLLIAWRFVSEDLAVGIAGVLVYTALGYATLSWLLPDEAGE